MGDHIRGSSHFWKFSPRFLVANLLIGVVVTFSFCPRCLLSLDLFLKSWDNILISSIFSAGLAHGAYRIQILFDRKMPWIHYPAKRFVFELLTYLIYAFSFSFVVYFILYSVFYPQFTVDNIPWKWLVVQTQMPLTIGLVLSFIFVSRSFLFEWRKAAIEAERLKTEHYAIQFQSLKEQLNPHFLFNSLNVLSNLVYENPDTASQFIRQLSRLYRYVLDVQQEELVPVEKEIEFAENYLALQKIRFEESLSYSIQVSENLKGYIPSLSLQLLLENAIKHNVVSNANPLLIEISEEFGKLVVKNSLQLRTSSLEDSSGIGLSNIKKRYALLSDEQIAISQVNGQFTVTLPVLDLKQK